MIATTADFWATTGFGVLLGALVSLVAQVVMFLVDGSRERRRSNGEVDREALQQQLGVLLQVLDDLNQTTTAVMSLVRPAEGAEVEGVAEPALIIGGGDVERSLLLNVLTARTPLLVDEGLREVLGKAKSDLVASFAPFGGPAEARVFFESLGSAKVAVGEAYRQRFSDWSSHS